MNLLDLKELLNNMSLEEKVGQMVQLSAHMLTNGGLITGPADAIEITEEHSKLIGSILGKIGAGDLHRIQEEFMEKHPHNIPLLFMYDVINGMETIYPIPLALGCTFSQELVKDTAEYTAIEAAARGLHVTFSPMLDLVRDARWGRVMESFGEDPWLNSRLGEAMVSGYQGSDGNIAACLKHFAAYGSPEGGRDYENVEISEATLREDYLPAYEAAIKKGCAMVMTSFNTWNRIPCTGNKWLLRNVLRDEMNFQGVVISDYKSIDEMITHGIAEDSREAAKLAIEAGVDIDMASNAYIGFLAELVKSGEVDEKLIDQAVWRILKLKNELGLFENPYKNASEEREQQLLLCKKHRDKAREVAVSSFVLLKNENILPLQKLQSENIAFIGPYVDTVELYGSWSFPTMPEKGVTIKQGVLNKGINANFIEVGYRMDSGTRDRFAKSIEYTERELEKQITKAIQLAKTADKVVLCLGEHRDQTGEGGSKVDIRIPENQLRLLKEIHKVNSNIVTIIFSGRPLDIQEIVLYSKAVLMVWMPGTEGGNAIADVLFGDTSPEGRLSMSIPRSVGQVPIYYNRFMTGRPNPTGTHIWYVNGYLDESTKPLYPFGYGLSYTNFDYSEVTLNSHKMSIQDMLQAKVKVTNVGNCAATETVQMYIRDVKGSVIRPLKMLKGFKKVCLQPGESREVVFEINENMLKFYDINMDYTSEAGMFHVFIGRDSDTDNKAEFELIM